MKLAAGIVPDLTPLRTSKDFRAVFGSRTVAYLGTQAADVALLVQAKQLTNSPLPVGLLGLAELVPLLAFGLYGGVLADRFDRKALMRWCEPGLAACAGLLLLNSLLPRPYLWPLYVLAAFMTAIAAVQRPSFEAAVPRLVPRSQQVAASALLSMSVTAMFLLGSTLGGVLAVTPGAYSVYALDAAGFCVSFALLSRLPPLPQAGGPQAGGPQAGGPQAGGPQAGGPQAAGGRAERPRAVPGDILAGLRYALSRRDLMGSYLVDLAAMIFAYPNALLPFLAAILHAPWATGLMFAAPSAGAFVTSATSGWMSRVRRHGVAIAVAAACWGAALGLLGLAPDSWVALVLLAIAGGADEVSGVFRVTLWNQTIPDELRGRMAGIELLSYGAGPPAGQLRGGAVAAVTSPRFSLASGGLACVIAVAAVCAALPAFWRYRTDPSAADPSLADNSAAGPSAEAGGTAEELTDRTAL